MIRVRTPSRLHFGLLALHAGAARRFGGVGLMVRDPGLEVMVRTSDRERVFGSPDQSLCDRSARLARRLVEEFSLPPLDIELRQTAEQHVGLGTGTQLSLALARAASLLADRPLGANQLAQVVGRGRRSAVGVHGFERGGLIVDGGRIDERIAPCIARISFPDSWPILLIRPNSTGSLYGDREEKALAQNAMAPAVSDRLCRLVLLGILPAAAAGDFDPFADAVHEYNRTVGECLAFAQGGPYSSAAATKIITSLRDQGIDAVGQSSWGPILFAIVSDAERAGWLAERLRTRTLGPADQLVVTTADNTGALVEDDSKGDE